jgi:DNA excision repair protein ERCC-4
MDSSAPPGQRAQKMLERRLRLYLWWKAKLGEKEKEGKGKSAGFHLPQRPKDFDRAKEDGISEALKKKDAKNQERTANRRRVRGAAPVQAGPSRPAASERTSNAVDEEIRGTGEMMNEAEDIAEL